MRTLALELAPDMIRVNSVHPTAVNTDMIQNSATYELFAPTCPRPSAPREALAPRFGTLNVLPIPWVEAIDVSTVALSLASDEARYITGVTLPVERGAADQVTDAAPAADLARTYQRVAAAAWLPRLDVLLDTSGEQDEELARDLARLGRGRLRRIRAHTDVAPALSAVFAG